MPITKIISGGQTGVDQGAILGAARAGIETGGWMPFGFMTEDGPNREFAEKYGLKECERTLSHGTDYALRTGRNVFDSNGTIRIASDFHTLGEKCTLNAIIRHGRPHFDVSVPSLREEPDSLVPSPFCVQQAAEWIQSNNIKILNFAGNRESTRPGIQKFTTQFVLDLIELLNAKID